MTGLATRALAIRRLTDPEQVRRARVIMIASATMVASVVGLALTRLALGDVGPAAVAGAIAGLAAAACACARYGRPGAAEWLVAAALACASVAVIAVQGPSSPRLGILQLGIILLGVAARPWMAPAHAALSVGILFVMLAAGLTTPLSPSTTPVWIAIARQIVVSTALVVLYNRGYRSEHAALARRSAELDAAHAELVAARARLERLVAARTAELARATIDLEAFASTVSHDLRAPLRHAAAFLALFGEDATALDDAQRARLAAAQAEAGELTAKLEAILAASRNAQRPAASEPRPTP